MIATSNRRNSHRSTAAPFELEDIAREVLIFGDVGHHLSHVIVVDYKFVLLLFGELRSGEAELIEHALHDGMQAACANILSRFIHPKGKVGNLVERLARELQVDAFRFEQRRVLLHQRRLRLGEDLDEVFDGERLQLDPDGEAALQLRNQITGFGDVEGAGGDKENVVGADHSVARVDRGSLDDGQNVTLYAFA